MLDFTESAAFYWNLPSSYRKCWNLWQNLKYFWWKKPAEYFEFVIGSTMLHPVWAHDHISKMDEKWNSEFPRRAQWQIWVKPQRYLLMKSVFTLLSVTPSDRDIADGDVLCFAASNGSGYSDVTRSRVQKTSYDPFDGAIIPSVSALLCILQKSLWFSATTKMDQFYAESIPPEWGHRTVPIRNLSLCALPIWYRLSGVSVSVQNIVSTVHWSSCCRPYDQSVRSIRCRRRDRGFGDFSSSSPVMKSDIEGLPMDPDIEWLQCDCRRLLRRRVPMNGWTLSFVCDPDSWWVTTSGDMDSIVKKDVFSWICCELFLFSDSEKIKSS